jgi:hypothetical protein
MVPDFTEPIIYHHNNDVSNGHTLIHRQVDANTVQPPLTQYVITSVAQDQYLGTHSASSTADQNPSTAPAKIGDSSERYTAAYDVATHANFPYHRSILDNTQAQTITTSAEEIGMSTVTAPLDILEQNLNRTGVIIFIEKDIVTKGDKSAFNHV